MRPVAAAAMVALLVTPEPHCELGLLDGGYDVEGLGVGPGRFYFDGEGSFQVELAILRGQGTRVIVARDVRASGRYWVGPGGPHACAGELLMRAGGVTSHYELVIDPDGAVLHGVRDEPGWSVGVFRAVRQIIGALLGR